MVACLGILVADLVAKPVERFPDRGKLLLVDRMELHVGGCAANTALALAKIGVETTILGKLGCDGLGEFIRNELAGHRIGTEGLVRDPDAPTSSTMVLVAPDGERSFLHSIGVNATFRESDIRFDLIRDASILNVSGCFLMPGFDGEPLARTLKRVDQETDATVVLDTAWDASGRWMELLAPSLPYVDYFLPSYEEAVEISGRTEPEAIAEVLLERGVKVIAIKLGERGAYVRTSDGTEHRIPPYRVHAVDSLGAGDCFVAGFVTGLAQGWDLETTARFACATGALCVTALGATTGIPPLDQIETFMRKG